MNLLYVENDLKQEIIDLNFDIIFAVDNGGDSIIESATSGLHGRDKKMLLLLQSIGLPLYNVVLSPGSDGESTYEEFQKCFNDMITKK